MRMLRISFQIEQEQHEPVQVKTHHGVCNNNLQNHNGQVQKGTSLSSPNILFWTFTSQERGVSTIGSKVLVKFNFIYILKKISFELFVTSYTTRQVYPRLISQECVMWECNNSSNYTRRNIAFFTAMLWNYTRPSPIVDGLNLDRKKFLFQQFLT